MECMDIYNVIRSGIFLTAALVMILFPKKVFRFQAFVLDKVHIKYDEEKTMRSNHYWSIVFIIISIALFIYAVIFA